MICPASVDPLSLPSVLLSDRRKLPAAAGIYFAIDNRGAVQYIGLSTNICGRWNAHHRFKHLTELEGVRISYLLCEDKLLENVERALIAYFQPPLNRSLHSKRKFEAKDGGKVAVLRLTEELIPFSSVTGLRMTNEEMAAELGMNRRSITTLRAGTSNGEWITLVKVSRWLSARHGRTFTIEEILDVEE